MTNEEKKKLFLGQVQGSTPAETKHLLENELKKHPRTMVLFYADWCGHCIDFQEVWNKLHQLKKIPMLCVEASDIDPSFLIQGFPTIKDYQNGKYYDYTSERTEVALLHHFNNICPKCGKKKNVSKKKTRTSKKKKNVSKKKIRTQKKRKGFN